MDSADPKREDRLASWKEIAVYLGCDERTCLRWEKKLGLPVHRMEGVFKSRVFAYRDELDRWMRERITLTGGAGRSGRPALVPGRILRLLLPAAGFTSATPSTPGTTASRGWISTISTATGWMN